MFRVDNLDELLSRLSKHGAEVVGEVVNYENIYRLCYIPWRRRTADRIGRKSIEIRHSVGKEGKRQKAKRKK